MLRASSRCLLSFSDPYFSIWSPYDKLMEGSTEQNKCEETFYWVLHVDGKVYRFWGER
ncbi:DUF4964 domain-containing protein [Bacteroides thetaiotaomicron]|nr:DUF4964 domain-containing protein [Bacteroides thetaiotaomicron]